MGVAGREREPRTKEGGGRPAQGPTAPLPGLLCSRVMAGGSLGGEGVGRGLRSPLLVPLCLQELFKAFARHLSHSLTQDPSRGRSVKEEAREVIKQLFHGRARCESEADWHGLCGPRR